MDRISLIQIAQNEIESNILSVQNKLGLSSQECLLALQLAQTTFNKVNNFERAYEDYKKEESK